MTDNYFIDIAKTIDGSAEILNWYRNLYHTENSDTERGIMARAINDILPEYSRQKAEIERLQSMNQAKLDTIHDLMAEVERLNQSILMAENVEINKEELLEKLQQSPIQILPGDDSLTRARSIEEFWTKVRAYAVVMGCYHIVEYGDSVVKEMVGE